MDIEKLMIDHSLRVHRYLIEPYLEGAERINRFVQGVNLHVVGYPKLEWKERIVDFAVGLALLLPCVNAIIWIGMQTFGLAEKLSDQLSIPEPPAPAPATPPPNSPPAPRPSASPRLGPVRLRLPQVRKETLKYKDQKGSETVYSDWTIQHRRQKIVVTKKEGNEMHIATYDSKWQLTSFVMKKEDLSIVLENRILKVTKGGDQLSDLPLKEGVIWVQQTTIAARTMSNQTADKIAMYDPEEHKLKVFTFSKKDLGTHFEASANLGWITAATLRIDKKDLTLLSMTYKEKTSAVTFRTNTSEIVR